MKDIIFAGCSYTWGQSLWYEANFPNDNHPRDGFFYGNKVCEECYEYIVENRFANQVAKYFKKNALVAATNGGDLIQSINFVKNRLEPIDQKLYNYFGFEDFNPEMLTKFYNQYKQLHRLD